MIGATKIAARVPRQRVCANFDGMDLEPGTGLPFRDNERIGTSKDSVCNLLHSS
jgi:hypothetical protein